MEFTAQFDRNVAVSTAGENSRYAINGVMVQRGAGDCQAVSTDGRMLAVVFAGDSSGDSGSAIVPLAVLGKKNGHKRVSVSVNGHVEAVDLKEVKRAGSMVENGARRTGDAVEGTFPPFVEVIPDVTDEWRFISVNPEFLARLRDLCDVESPCVTLAIPPSPKKLLVAANENGLAVIMPVYVEIDNYPKWFGEKRDLVAKTNKAAIEAGKA